MIKSDNIFRLPIKSDNIWKKQKGHLDRERILLIIPTPMLHKIDKFCETHYYNRTEFIKHSIRKALKEND